MKKSLIRLLVALLLVSTFSCAKKEESSSADTTSIMKQIESETKTQGRTIMEDNLPEFDFKGEEFNLLISVEDFWGDSVHIPEEMTGEVLDDARIKIIRDTEERFHVKIQETVQSFEEVNNQMRKKILAGDATYDWIFLRDSYADMFVQEGLLVEYSNLPYVNLSQVYWDQKLLQASTINNRCYFTFGAFDTTYLDRTHCLVFNKNMVEDYDIANPYELVSSGKWTTETMSVMMKDVVKDSNGDGKMNIEDQWGYLCNPKQVLVNFWTAAGEQTVKKDSKDLLYFGLSGNQRFFDLFHKVYQMFWDNPTWCNKDTGKYDISEVAISMFTNGLGLFMDENFSGIKNLRNVDINFGILPYPKLDEQQEDYYARIEAAYKVGCVPITNTRLEMTSALMEALQCAAYNTVIPAYYDVTLKTKSTRDSESEAMLDVIFNSQSFDYGDTWWCDSIRDGIFGKMFGDNNRNLSSKLASVEKAVEKHIAKTLPAYMVD